MVDNRPKLKRVLINGIDVSDYVVNWEAITEYKKYIGEATVVLNQAVSAVLPINIDDAPGWAVTIERGVVSATEEYVFRGEVNVVKPDGARWELSCVDKYYQAVKADINTSYDIGIDPELGNGRDIFVSLITENTDLNIDNTTAVDTGSAIIIQKYTCKNTDVYERCDKLANLYLYQHYYNPIDDYVYFEPQGYVDSGVILTVGEDIVEAPIWVSDKSELKNKITIVASEQEVGETKFFDGDNTEGQTSLLTYTPRSVKVYIGTGSFDPTGTGTKPSDNEGNLKQGGKKGSTSGTYDYNYDDDKRVKTVYYYDSSVADEPSYTPPIGTNNIEIQYTYGLPIVITGSNETSISDYTKHATTIELSDVKTFDDAENYLSAYLSFYSTPFISTTLKVSNAGEIRVGRVYRVVDNINNIDKELIVTKVRKRWPYAYDEVTIGNEVLRELTFTLNTLDRLKRIEEAISQSDDLIVKKIEFTTTYTYDSRYFKLQQQNIAGDVGLYGHPRFGLYGTAEYGASTSGGFILGHTTFGILGTSTLGSGATSPITTRIIQGKNIYKEFLYDDDFLDSGNTTATWNTATQYITFASGQVAQTSQISLGTAHTYYTVSLGSLTGSVLTEISGDNGDTWETVTLSARTAFTSSDGTGVLLRFTEDAATTASITNTEKISEAPNLPAIKLKLE